MIRVFLITLQSSRQRRVSALEQLHRTSLRYEIVEGIDAKQWREDALPVDRREWGSSLVAGEVGCYLAHLNSLRRIVDYALPWGCVLEDDFWFESDVDFTLEQIVPTLPHDFHYIDLSRDLNLGMEYARVSINRHYDRLRGTALTTTGYLVTNPLAQYILAEHAVCRMPIDHLYYRLSHQGNFYAPVKPLVSVRDFASTIH